MRLYPSLFAYLNNNQPVSEDTLLRVRDRPIIALDPQEDVAAKPYLIPISNQVYEIAFPYLKPTDINPNTNNLEYIFDLTICGESHKLRVADEVLDLDTITEENELLAWEQKLERRLDHTATLLIKLLVGMFTIIFEDGKARQPTILTSQLQDKLGKVSSDEANLPIVISLERQYHLRRKLEAIASKLRHQLRRQAKLMPVSKIQEMDAYCLRDYIRRPGITAAQKAGAKQELMGIQRYQDFNTPENKFLVYFTRILYLNCYRYEKSSATQYKTEIEKLRSVIDLFKQEEVIQTIQDRQYHFTKPNYVLQQNPFYRSFYQAYLKYTQKRYEKECLWSFRNQLFSDTVYICLTAALLRFEEIGVDALQNITGSNVPDQGRYIQNEASIKIRVFMAQQVYAFSLSQPPQKIFSDWLLTWEIHQLDTDILEIKKLACPIWVFWYRPSNEAIAQINKYLNNLIKTHNVKVALVIYFQSPPIESPEKTTIESFFDKKLWVIRLPEPRAKSGFYNAVDLMARVIKKAVEFSV